ncbi:hypothetical protein HHX47_DHR6000719 [Lentinula edodes]|nr:hypothetical protein HHX47_DHR6000719 [Lentinula edodes]
MREWEYKNSPGAMSIHGIQNGGPEGHLSATISFRAASVALSTIITSDFGSDPVARGPNPKNSRNRSTGASQSEGNDSIPSTPSTTSHSRVDVESQPHPEPTMKSESSTESVKEGKKRVHSKSTFTSGLTTMHLLHHQVQDKPVEKIQPGVNNLSEAQDEHIAQGLESMVAHSETNHDVSHGIHMHGKNVFEVPWIHKMIPGIEKLASNYHIGNFVVVRESGERIFESMPIYARIKGDEFSIPNLLQVPVDSSTAIEFDGASMAIFRLAPADYHRFHCPIDGVVGDTTNVPGQYYTVNPQAVNEPKFDVFTANVRSILYLTHTATGKRVAFVAIGALLVGSIVWTKGAEKGAEVRRGEELGYFAYGGSTVIALFPKGVVEFDQDLVKNSEEPIETLVKVGSSLGTTPTA